MTDRRSQYADHKFLSEIHSDVSMISDKDKEVIEKALNKEWTNPKYKMKYFVGQAQITPFSKFRQWLLEIKSKEESIENMEYEMAKFEIEVARFQRMADEAYDDLDRRLAEVEKWNAERNLIMSKRRLQDWYLERQHLLDLLDEFSQSEEAIIPDGTGRTYWDIINTEEEDVHEEIYWTNRLAKQAATDMLFYGRIGTGNMDAILSMSPEQQAETLALTMNFSTQIQAHTLQLQAEAEQNLKINGKMNNQSLVAPSQETTRLESAPATAPDSNEDINDVYNI
jgi:hypothetical protein|tara:strand:- start:474 stop:1319 length:846 start_codon:yes stop_codon:yes gene_type:complete